MGGEGISFHRGSLNFGVSSPNFKVLPQDFVLRPQICMPGSGSMYSQTKKLRTVLPKNKKDPKFKKPKEKSTVN